MFKKFIAKMIGKIIAKKLDLKEAHEMDDKKKWWQSKSVLTGIVTIAIGLYESVAVNLAPEMGWAIPGIPGWLFAILGSIGVYGRVVATKKLK